MNIKKKHKFITLTLAVLMAFSSVPVFGVSSDVTQAFPQTEIPREYVVTSDLNLREMNYPKGVEKIEFADAHMALIKVSSKTDPKVLERELKAKFNDLKMQPNFVYRKAESRVFARDPYYSSQWGLDNPGTGVDIDYEEAIAFLAGKKMKKKKTIVAVIDTGIDVSHEDLAANIWVNKGEIPGNGKDDDKNGYADDVNGYDFHNGKALQSAGFSSEYNHGTHCAGIIGAVTGNYKGIAGIGSACGKVALMDLKVLGKGGTGDSFNVIQAIKYAEKNGADICNLSMCTYEDDALLRSTIRKSKMLFVCSAGNDGYNLSEIQSYPGCYQMNNMICVANMDETGHLYKTSNYSSIYADIAAPGTKIYSTVPGGEYRLMTGTSMAAPFVSGVAALLHSYYEEISAEDMRTILLQGAVRTSALSDKVACGGYLNAYIPLAAYPQDYFKPDVTAPELSVSVSDVEGSYKQRLDIKVSDNSGITPLVRYSRGSHNKAYFRNGKGLDVNLDENDSGFRLMGVPQTYTVYAADESGNDVLKKVVCTADAVSSLKLSNTKKTLRKGQTFRLKATLSKSGKNGRKLTYSSSKKSVATVSSKGLIKAKKKGTAYITVKTGNLLTAKCKVIVK